MLEELVAEVASLPQALLRQLPLDAEILGLLAEAAPLKGGARNRQVKYVTKLLKDVPLEPVYEFLSRRKGAALEEKKAFHELEYLRDALLSEAIARQEDAEANGEDFGGDWESRVAEEIKKTLPRIDARALASLAWMYTRGRNPRYSREIFRQLRAAHDLQKRADARSTS